MWPQITYCILVHTETATKETKSFGGGFLFLAFYIKKSSFNNRIDLTHKGVRMLKQMTLTRKVRRRPTFFSSVCGGSYFRLRGSRRGLVYYMSTKYVCYPVLSDGTISPIVVKLTHVSLGTWTDVLKAKEIGIGNGAWEDEGRLS